MAHNRASVLDAAVELADDEGLDAVSMRRLATRLGIVPMALYKHVADKDDLVAGMIDAVVAGYPEPEADAGWQAKVRGRVLGARAALLRHPWLRPAIETASTRTPTVLGHLDAVAADLLSAGLSADLVHHAMHALGHRIWGFSPEAFAGGAPTVPPSPEEGAALAARFPAIAAIATDTAARGGACDDDAEFDFTLALLLDAIERLHASGWESAPMRDRRPDGGP